MSIEFLLAQTEFERVLLPFKRNLADIGIDLVIRRVDVSQYINRLRSRDFDMVVGSFPQSNSPGNEQREFWKSSSADKPGSRNLMGLKDPAVDELVEALIDSDSRQSLVEHARALDRVLQWGFYVIPNWPYQDLARGLLGPYRPPESLTGLRCRPLHLVDQAGCQAGGNAANRQHECGAIIRCWPIFFADCY